MYFFVVVRHPDFYNYAQSKNGASGVLMNTLTKPSATGLIPSLFAANTLASKNTKPANAIPAAATIAKSLFGGNTRRNHRRTKQTKKRSRFNRRSF
jgi:hypothetical protein